MKKNIRIATGIVVCLALVAGGYWALHQRNTGGATDATGAPGSAPRSASGGGGAGGAGAGAPVSVSIVKAVQRDQPVTLDATGTVSSLNIVDVHPQVSSLITKVHVREGQFVQRGQLLFTLDDRNDQVNLTKAVAQLAKDQAALADAQRQLARNKDLVQQQFLSQSSLDTSETLVKSQAAAVTASQAAVDATKLSLSYDQVLAPSAGRVGAIGVFAGTLVQPTTTVLLTITQLDPIAVTFSLPQRYLSDALEGLRHGEGQVTAQLPGAHEALRGKLDFVDSAVDGPTGTVRVKALFANPQNALWPGAYATVHMTAQTLKDAIVVPLEAIINSQEGDSVYLAGTDHKAALRKITVLYAADGNAAVSGIAVGDPVIVDGRRNVRAGSAVVVRADMVAGKP